MLLETRLLLNQESGWAAHTYVWNKEQTEAYLKVTGHTHESMMYYLNDEKNTLTTEYLIKINAKNVI